MATARQLFAATNYRAATVAGIAAAAGISEPVIYRHFPSKKHLYLAVLADVLARREARWQRLCEAEPTALARLRRLTQDGWAAAAAEDHLLLHKAAAEAGDDEIRLLLSDGCAAAVRRLEDLVRQAQVDGELRRDLPAAVVAWQLLSLGTAAGWFALLEPGGWTPADGTRQLDAYLRSIGTQEARS